MHVGMFIKCKIDMAHGGIPRQIINVCAGLLVALSLTALAGGAQAQDLDGIAVITAPDDPGRAAPGAMNFAAPVRPTLNSFAPVGMPPSAERMPIAALPVVVELFTSQGCSSCPPADAMIARLSERRDILPLSFHVDYWDYLGWTDSFARPEFTDRQEGYARASGERALYTPQLIIDGRDTAVAPGPAQLMSLIEGHRIAPAMLSVQRESTDDGEVIEMSPLSELGAPMAILLVRFAPQREIQVTSGENRGRTITYANVVLGLDELARWNGEQPLRLTVRPDEANGEDFPPDTRHALLVQQELGDASLPGPILAAVPLD
ncbi:DUF1223 domain-containing protein [Paracoccus seriniphilus]|uniref:DUF1223 domain-containing protein n=1 Tax=Paracoccus seriniphilus TaxID=184748 RepID=A0A239PW29_9RHOB|nr:DUF1223 domain-containing protein [Paracoccus seriniphilus]SNT74308.1 hypothetical protein SAMN05444959_10722 [Paracoccus seriniphilus]